MVALAPGLIGHLEGLVLGVGVAVLHADETQTQRPRVRLVRETDGRWSWADLLRPPPADGPRAGFPTIVVEDGTFLLTERSVRDDWTWVDHRLVVPAASGKRHMTELSPAEHVGLIRAFSDLERPLDTMIIDTAAGLGDSVLTFCQAAHDVLVVVVGVFVLGTVPQFLGSLNRPFDDAFRGAVYVFRAKRKAKLQHCPWIWNDQHQFIIRVEIRVSYNDMHSHPNDFASNK